MLGADLATFELALLCFALVAAALAVVLLSIEFFGSRRLAQSAPGVLAAVMTATGLLGWGVLGWPGIAVGGVFLAMLLLVAWPLCFETWRQRLRKLVSPTLVWLCVLGISMVASRYLAAHVLRSLHLPAQPAAVDIEDSPVRNLHAVTDQGTTIGLFHFKMHSTVAEIESYIRETEKGRSQLIRLAEANPASNCHGWLFTGGEYGVRDEDVPHILNDNGYVEVADAREGDLAVYSVGAQVSHTGIVRMKHKPSPTLIESKWGPMGVYLHAVDQLPFPGICRFYRSPREGHMLVIGNASAASATLATGGRPAVD